MTKRLLNLCCLIVLFAVAGQCLAQPTLIRNATVHTALQREPLTGTDVLLRNGNIAAIGENLDAPDNAQVIDADGRPLTPGLFGGVSALGIQEVSLEEDTVDNGLALAHETGTMRPEFDVTLAFNPLSTVIDTNRAEGVTWTLLGASVNQNGNLIAGQGAAVSLSGEFNAVLEGSRSLFLNMGADASAFSGSSRAAQYMLIEQAIREAGSTPRNIQFEQRLLTSGGRSILGRYLKDGRWIVDVDRAADILRVMAMADRHDLQLIILGGTEAWRVADQLAEAEIPVILNSLDNLPGSFDQLGARLDNAALLSNAGVRIAFTGGGTHNARKIRQIAGNAVANGLDWYTALRGITRNPAIMLGLSDNTGAIREGFRGDVVLWNGDPLEVTSYAEVAWINGRPVNQNTRQQQLLERYLPETPEAPRHYIK